MDGSLREKAYQHHIYQVGDNNREDWIIPVSSFAITEDARNTFEFVTDRYGTIRFVLTLWDGEESYVG